MQQFSVIYLNIWSDDISYYSIRLKMFEKGLYKMMADDSKILSLLVLVVSLKSWLKRGLIEIIIVPNLSNL